MLLVHLPRPDVPVDVGGDADARVSQYPPHHLQLGPVFQHLRGVRVPDPLQGVLMSQPLGMKEGEEAGQRLALRLSRGRGGLLYPVGEVFLDVSSCGGRQPVEEAPREVLRRAVWFPPTCAPSGVW